MLPRMVPLEDEEISAELEKAFRKRGIQIFTEAKVESVKKDAEGATVAFRDKAGQAQTLVGRARAHGRGPRPARRAIWVWTRRARRLERGFVHVGPYMETAEPHVYAIGDIVAGMPQLAHAASMEGIIAVGKIAGKHVPPLERRRIPNCTYCEPQIGSIGLTERQAREAGHAVKIGKFPFLGNSKATILDHHEGFIKVVAEDKSGEILGVHIIGPLATEILAEPVTALQLEATVDDMMFTVHAHPTVWEAMGDAFASVRGAGDSHLTAVWAALTNNGCAEQDLQGSRLGPDRLRRGLRAAAAAGSRAQGRSRAGRAAALRASARDHARPQRQARTFARFRRSCCGRWASNSIAATAAAISPITARDRLVGYPILHLAEIRRDVGWYVRQLEEAMIRATAAFGIDRVPRAGTHGRLGASAAGELGAPSGEEVAGSGPDVPEEKLGAIGVHISRWVTSHGFAYNVSTDLRYFDLIVPCGIADRRATSLEKVLGRSVPIAEVSAASDRRVWLCSWPGDGAAPPAKNRENG